MNRKINEIGKKEVFEIIVRSKEELKKSKLNKYFKTLHLLCALKDNS